MTLFLALPLHLLNNGDIWHFCTFLQSNSLCAHLSLISCVDAGFLTACHAAILHHNSQFDFSCMKIIGAIGLLLGLQVKKT